MKKARTTAAIGAGLLVLIGLAFVRRGLVAGSASPPHPTPSVAAALERSVLEQSVAPARGAARPMPGEVRTSPSFPSEGFPDLESKRARRRAEEDYWEDLGALLEARSKIEPAKYREKVSAMTAAYLGLDPSRAAMFDRTAARATEEVGRSWKLRNESIEALSEALSHDERERKEQQIQEAYEAAKVQALAPLDSFLDDSPRKESFRQRLGEWFDAVR